MRRRWRALAEQLDSIRRTLDQLERRYEKMETILMVREPGSAAAAEAYDGLRKQVVSSVSERVAHLTQLAQFDTEVAHGAGADVLAKLVDSWLEQASLARIDDPSHPNLEAIFEFVDSDDGGEVEILKPAYADMNTGRLIRAGVARRVNRPADPLPPEAPGPDAGDEPGPHPTGGQS